jgi:hypothetical protein
MNDTALPERTIAASVASARRKLGVHRLAKRADVPPAMIQGVCSGLIGFDPGPLRRLLAEAEAALQGRSPDPPHERGQP